ALGTRRHAVRRGGGLRGPPPVRSRRPAGREPSPRKAHVASRRDAGGRRVNRSDGGTGGSSASRARSPRGGRRRRRATRTRRPEQPGRRRSSLCYRTTDAEWKASSGDWPAGRILSHQLAGSNTWLQTPVNGSQVSSVHRRPSSQSTGLQASSVVVVVVVVVVGAVVVVVLLVDVVQFEGDKLMQEHL